MIKSLGVQFILKRLPIRRKTLCAMVLAFFSSLCEADLFDRYKEMESRGNGHLSRFANEIVQWHFDCIKKEGEGSREAVNKIDARIRKLEESRKIFKDAARMGTMRIDEYNKKIISIDREFLSLSKEKVDILEEVQKRMGEHKTKAEKAARNQGGYYTLVTKGAEYRPSESEGMPDGIQIAEIVGLPNTILEQKTEYKLMPLDFYLEKASKTADSLDKVSKMEWFRSEDLSENGILSCILYYLYLIEGIDEFKDIWVRFSSRPSFEERVAKIKRNGNEISRSFLDFYLKDMMAIMRANTDDEKRTREKLPTMDELKARYDDAMLALGKLKNDKALAEKLSAWREEVIKTKNAIDELDNEFRYYEKNIGRAMKEELENKEEAASNIYKENDRLALETKTLRDALAAEMSNMRRIFEESRTLMENFFEEWRKSPGHDIDFLPKADADFQKAIHDMAVVCGLSPREVLTEKLGEFSAKAVYGIEADGDIFTAIKKADNAFDAMLDEKCKEVLEGIKKYKEGDAIRIETRRFRIKGRITKIRASDLIVGMKTIPFNELDDETRAGVDEKWGVVYLRRLRGDLAEKMRDEGREARLVAKELLLAGYLPNVASGKDFSLNAHASGETQFTSDWIPARDFIDRQCGEKTRISCFVDFLTAKGLVKVSADSLVLTTPEAYAEGAHDKTIEAWMSLDSSKLLENLCARAKEYLGVMDKATGNADSYRKAKNDIGAQKMMMDRNKSSRVEVRNALESLKDNFESLKFSFLASLDYMLPPSQNVLNITMENLIEAFEKAILPPDEAIAPLNKVIADCKRNAQKDFESAKKMLDSM